MRATSPKKTPSSATAFDGVFFSTRLVSWYKQNHRKLPWRTLWAKHKDPWHIWVSEIMLQQTVIKAVIPVYEKFLKQFPDYRSLSAAKPEDVRLAVRGLGYYRRFDLLHRACKQLTSIDQNLPNSHDEWIKLPGIGDYTAAAIASITANEPFGVVDGNVERVLCRLMDIRSEPNLPHLKKMFKLLMDDICQQTDPGTFNQAVMELGQTICTPSNPSCDQCPVSSICTALKHSSQHLAPAPKKKQKTADVSLELQIIKTTAGIALFKRPDDAKFLPGTWGFATYIRSGQGWELDGTTRGIKKVVAEKVGEIRHSITKHKITASVTFSKTSLSKKSGIIKITAAKDVEGSLVSNLDRKAWNVLLRTSKQHT